MKFKSLFLSLCILFIGATAFAGTPGITFDGDEPLTLKAVNKEIHKAMAELPTDAEVKLVSASSILKDDAECTVTVNIDIAGNGGSVSATAATCREALNMVIAIVHN